MVLMMSPSFTLCRKQNAVESIASMLWRKGFGRFMWNCKWQRRKEIYFMWEPERVFFLGQCSPFSEWLV